MGNNPNNKIAIDFLDPLFAVILHLSFDQIRHEEWFLIPRLIFAEPNLFHVAILSLGYTTVILSWIGYHISVHKCGIDVKKTYGKWRFFFDIVLLFSYFVLLENYKALGKALWILSFIFFVFILWDHMKRLEWPDTRIEKDEARGKRWQEERRKRQQRRGVTVLWFFIFLGLAFLYRLRPSAGICGCADCLALVAAFLGAFLYRTHKDKLWGKPCLMLLGKPQSNV
jgi:hypothetical protein